MNLRSTFLLVTGVFLLTATCSGQRPSDKKIFVHFATDIIKVDSILSRSSQSKKQSISNIPLHNRKCNKESMRSELNQNEAIRKENPSHYDL
jgi:hypothetical protein